MQALGSAMDEPEDLLQLVLGMTSPSLFTELFTDGASVSADRLDNWFDTKAKTFGGNDAIDTVQSLIGNCSRFDYQDLKKIPPKDLADLQLFFEAMLAFNKRRVLREDTGMVFKTPDEWLNDAGVRRRYEGLVFSRELKGKDAALRVVGVGHKVFDQALLQASNFDACLTQIAGLEEPLTVFKIFDRVTSQEGNVRQVIIGVRLDKNEILHDWELVDLLNQILKSKKLDSENKTDFTSEKLNKLMLNSEKVIREQINNLNFPFNVPEIKPLALFLP